MSRTMWILLSLLAILSIGTIWRHESGMPTPQHQMCKEPLFTQKAAADLLNVPYMQNIQHRDMDIEELYKISEVWIKNLPDFQANKFNKTTIA